MILILPRIQTDHLTECAYCTTLYVLHGQISCTDKHCVMLVVCITLWVLHQQMEIIIAFCSGQRMGDADAKCDNAAGAIDMCAAYCSQL